MSRVRDIIPYSLRMPDSLKSQLSERAKQNGRSLNSEMVMILQDAVNSASPQPRSSAEHAAAIQAEEVKKMVFDTLVKLYENKK